MSKFTIKVKLQGLEIEVEGTKDDAPRIASQLGKQIGGLLQAPAALASGNGAMTIEAEVVDSENGAGKRKRARKSGGGGTKAAPDDLSFVHDSANYGTPQQDWTQTQKAIWFLYIVNEQAHVSQQTAYGLMKNFNRYFKSSGQINNGNVMKGLDKEKLKGPSAPVGTDVTDGTTKYFLTQTGISMAQRLAKGEKVTTD